MKFSTPAHLLLSGACALALATGAWADNLPSAAPAFGHDRPLLFADRDDHRGGDHRGDDHHGAVFHVDRRGAVWGHGDIRSFHDHDWDAWHGGRWVHDWHGGHLGWWWVVGGAWIFFNAPVYPYPDPYIPPTVIVQNVPAAPAAPSAPPAAGAAPVPAPAYWYYCPSAQNYYPYVTNCPVQWQQVPASPPPAPGSSAPPATSNNSTW